MQHQRLLTGAACCLFPLFAQAAMPAVNACPDSVPATMISLNAVPAGWTPYIGAIAGGSQAAAISA
jgi:hypothetical protein